MRYILLIVFAISLSIVFISGRIYASRALNPVSKIIKEVDQIGISNLNERIDVGNGKDELARLGFTFNKMLHRLEIAFKTQKNFIANASHELRTPLTILTGQLEVLLLKERSKEDYIQTLATVLEEIKNLNHISDRLLLLAQTSSDFANTTFAPLRIDEPLWLAESEIVKRNAGYLVKVNFGDHIESDENLYVFGNDLLLKTAFGNLIENACKYSDDREVNICLEHSDDHLKISFSDHGTGISREELKMIFQPFFRGKNQLSKKGHGLGLSLVEKIIQLHQGEICVESEEGKGSVFTVTLPVFK
ncbi:MAG: HAMP domain-containing histidine kinase, partial [Bacteroidales bacterium]|nr:HAMP domain-containing histidine kinase [Bacteroidales bacterium]